MNFRCKQKVVGTKKERHIMCDEKEVEDRLHGVNTNPDMRTTQPFSRKRSKGNGVPDRGNTTYSVWKLKVSAGWGNSQVFTQG